MKPWLAISSLCCALSAACSGEQAAARPQWLVTVTTDAPVPLFGDQVLIEVLGEGGELACSECRRMFDGGSADRYPLSFGVEASLSATRVRARLFRSVNVGPDGLPSGTALIDVVGQLPVAQGVTGAWLSLDARCFDVPANLGDGTSCDPVSRTAVPIRVLGEPPTSPPEPGTWPPVEEIPCPSAPPSGMVCVPGGLFLLGRSVAIRGGSRLGTSGFQAEDETPERVVRVRPFAIDQDEVTLGTVASLAAVGRYRTSLDPTCTYSGMNTTLNGARPINCTTWNLASRVCDALGKRLPTEAEWEYAASGGASENEFPWGTDDDVCSHAYVARANDLGLSNGCHDQDSLGHVGPVAGGLPGDVTALGIRNLGGNVGEWTEDDAARYDDPCWAYDEFPRDSRACQASDLPDRQKIFRGGYWNGEEITARGSVRSSVPLDGTGLPVGIRCAYSFP
jgi:sulfatase modifying factor 1